KRIDHLYHCTSGDPLDGTPATLTQNQSLSNWSVKADLSYVHGQHNVKVCTQLMQTRLNEKFRVGITDPTFNAVCLDDNGDPQDLPKVTNPDNCAKAGFSPNPDLLPGLVPYDLTRGGSPFQFKGSANINQYAFYVQDAI